MLKTLTTLAIAIVAMFAANVKAFDFGDVPATQPVLDAADPFGFGYTMTLNGVTLSWTNQPTAYLADTNAVTKQATININGVVGGLSSNNTFVVSGASPVTIAVNEQTGSTSSNLAFTVTETDAIALAAMVNKLSATNTADASAFTTLTNYLYGGSYPHGVATDGTNIYVASTTNPPRIYKFVHGASGYEVERYATMTNTTSAPQILYDAQSGCLWAMLCGTTTYRGLYRVELSDLSATRTTSSTTLTGYFAGDSNGTIAQDDQYVYGMAGPTAIARYQKGVGHLATTVTGPVNWDKHTGTTIDPLGFLCSGSSDGIIVIDKTAWVLWQTNYLSGVTIADDSAWYKDDTGIYFVCAKESAAELMTVQVGACTNGVYNRMTNFVFSTIALPAASYGVFGGGDMTRRYPDLYNGKPYAAPLWAVCGSTLSRIDLHPDGTKARTDYAIGEASLNEFVQTTDGSKVLTTYTDPARVLDVAIDDTLDADTRVVESPLLPRKQILGYYTTGQVDRANANLPYVARSSGTATNLTAAGTFSADTVRATTSAGGALQAIGGGNCLTWGAGGGCNVTTTDGLTVGGTLAVTGKVATVGGNQIADYVGVTNIAAAKLDRSNGTATNLSVSGTLTLNGTGVYVQCWQTVYALASQAYNATVTPGWRALAAAATNGIGYINGDLLCRQWSVLELTIGTLAASPQSSNSVAWAAYGLGGDSPRLTAFTMPAVSSATYTNLSIVIPPYTNHPSIAWGGTYVNLAITTIRTNTAGIVDVYRARWRPADASDIDRYSITQ